MFLSLLLRCWFNVVVVVAVVVVVGGVDMVVAVIVVSVLTGIVVIVFIIVISKEVEPCVERRPDAATLVNHELVVSQGCA